MKTTNKLNFTAMRIVFPLCLALTWLSGPVGASITSGPANDPVTCDPNGICTSITQLTVGPGPGAGSPINPADYGMCGILHLSGTFDSSTVARIIIASNGYYAVERKGTGGVPQVDWTCVLFTDFQGLPHDYLAKLETYQSLTGPTKSGGKATNTIGHGGDACIWSGLSGTLSANADTSASVFAQYDGPPPPYTAAPYTLESAQSAPKTSVETYSFCTGVPSGGFNWYTFKTKVKPGLGSTSGSVPAELYPPSVPRGFRFWCYIDGVGTSQGGTFSSAGLQFYGDPFDSNPYNLTRYNYDVGKESQLWFNCMEQNQYKFGTL